MFHGCGRQGVVVLAFLTDVMAANEKVKYGQLAAIWELDEWKAAECWWFDS